MVMFHWDTRCHCGIMIWTEEQYLPNAFEELQGVHGLRLEGTRMALLGMRTSIRRNFLVTLYNNNYYFFHYCKG